MYPTKKLSEICDIQNGYAFDANLFSDVDGFPIIRIRDLKNSTIQTLYKGDIKENFIVRKGDYLIGMDGEFRCYEWNNSDALLNQRVCRIIKYHESILPKFLFYGINKYLKEIEEVTPFVTVKHISSRQIKDIGFPLPPISTQSRIVARLDSAFASIDEQISLLRANIADVENMRKSVLMDIFDKSEYVKVKLIDITSVLGDGLHGTPKYDENGGYYFINGNNLNDGNILIKADTKKVSIDEYEKYKKPLNDRTILVSINGTIGNVAFYDNEKVVLGKSACYFNIQENVDKYYIKYVFMSPYFMEYANKELTGTTIKNVSLKTMRKFPIPLPPLPRQHEIVAHLDRVFAGTEALRTEYEAHIRDLETLRQSLLEEAFAGRLVQDNEA